MRAPRKLSSPRANAGRGATINDVSDRFNLPSRELDGDWLDTRAQIDGEPAPERTSVQLLKPKTIISYNTSPDVPFDRSINPLVGCDQRRNGCVTPEAIASKRGTNRKRAYGRYSLHSLVDA